MAPVVVVVVVVVNDDVAAARLPVRVRVLEFQLMVHEHVRVRRHQRPHEKRQSNRNGCQDEHATKFPPQRAVAAARAPQKAS